MQTLLGPQFLRFFASHLMQILCIRLANQSMWPAWYFNKIASPARASSREYPSLFSDWCIACIVSSINTNSCHQTTRASKAEEKNQSKETSHFWEWRLSQLLQVSVHLRPHFQFGAAWQGVKGANQTAHLFFILSCLFNDALVLSCTGYSFTVVFVRTQTHQSTIPSLAVSLLTTQFDPICTGEMTTVTTVLPCLMKLSAFSFVVIKYIYIYHPLSLAVNMSFFCVTIVMLERDSFPFWMVNRTPSSRFRSIWWQLQATRFYTLTWDDYRLIIVAIVDFIAEHSICEWIPLVHVSSCLLYTVYH